MCKIFNSGLILLCSITPRQWLSGAEIRSSFNSCYELYFILLSASVSGCTNNIKKLRFAEVCCHATYLFLKLMA